MVCGLLLLPPSSVHADSGMHSRTEASHHADHHAAHGHPAAASEDVSALPVDQDIADGFEGDPCCGGICLTAALCALSDVSVTVAQTTRFLPDQEVLISADARGHLRPPRA